MKQPCPTAGEGCLSLNDPACKQPLPRSLGEGSTAVARNERKDGRGRGPRGNASTPREPLHPSITPSLHHSITPSLHHPLTPSLHPLVTRSPRHRPSLCLNPRRVQITTVPHCTHRVLNSAGVSASPRYT